MKTKKIKSAFIGMFACVSMTCVGLAISSNNMVTTMADESQATFFSMEAGAGIRLNGDGGLRFKVMMGDAIKQSIVDNDTNNNVSLHFIITLKDYFNAIDDGNYLDVEKKILVDIPDDKIYYENGYWHANGCVYGVLEKNIHLEYTSIAYIQDNSAVTPVYQYATYLGDENVRSIYEVLNKAVLDGEENYYQDYLKNVNAYSWYGTEKAPILPETSNQLAKLYDIVNQGNTLENKYYYSIDGVTTDAVIEDGKSLNATQVPVVLVNFDTMGGNAIGSTYLKKGTVPVAPIAPVKEGYIFKGWQVNGQPYNFTEALTENTTLTAVWEAGVEIKFASSSWMSLADDQLRPLEHDGDKWGLLNYTAYGQWQSFSTYWVFDLTVEDIDAYIAAGYVAMEYAVTYHTNGDPFVMFDGTSLAGAGTVNKTMTMAELKAYVENGTTNFVNCPWATAGQFYVSGMKLVKAKPIITFEFNGEVVSTTQIENGAMVEKVGLAGYSDIIWKLNGETFDFNTPITEDITLTASVADATIKEIGFTADSWFSIGDDQLRPLENDGNKYGLLNYTGYGQWQSFQTYWKFDLTVEDVEAWMNAGYTHLAYTVTYISTGNPFVLFDGTSLADAGTVNMTMTLAQLKAYIENGTTNFVNCGWGVAGQFYVSNMTITVKEIGFTADSWFSIGDDQYRALERDGDKWGLLNYTAYGQWQSFSTYWKFNLTVADIDAYIAAGYVGIEYTVTYNTNADAFVMFDGTSLAGAGTVNKTMTMAELKAYIENGTTNFATCGWATAGQFYVSGMKLVKAKPIITFEFNGEVVSTTQIENGAMVEKVGLAGYSDIIWKLNGETFDFNTPITEDITLTASVADATIKEIGFTADSWFSIGDDQLRPLENDGNKYGLLNYTGYGQWQSFQTYWKFDLTVEDVEAWMNAGYTHLAYTVTYISTGNPFVLFDGTSLADAGTVNMTMTLAQLKAYIENGTTNFVNCGWGVAGQFYVSNMTITVKEIGFTADSWFSIGDDQYRALERDGDKWGLLNYTAYGQWQSFSTYWKFNLTVADIDAYIAAGYVGIEYTVTYNTNADAFVMFDGTSLAGAGTVNKTMTMAELKAYIENGTTNFATCGWATAGQFFVSGMKLVK